MKHGLIRLIIKWLGVNDILEHITNEQFLKMADVYQLIEDIDEEYPGKMEDFLKEMYSD